ncbi:Hypothetical predicted protein [Lynx pardinus]|uniref:Uncharacterized protein n=1 Tax=Lynx pardinus TaxID=191816 RepID=A0A485P0Y2_LYNPA|nr:Hypothetical predicted protein [Lynx pardinus]
MGPCKLGPATTELVPRAGAYNYGQKTFMFSPGHVLRTGSVYFLNTSARSPGNCVPSPTTQPSVETVVGAMGLKRLLRRE